MMTPSEVDSVFDEFCANYPEQSVDRSFGLPLPKTWTTTPDVPKPLYMLGNLGADRWPSTGRGHPVEVMPERYPVALNLTHALSAGVLCGIALYVAKRLGENTTAWQTFFALADELESSDLDTLCATALTLAQ